MLQAPEPVPAPVYKFTRVCLPANLRAGIKLPLSCTVSNAVNISNAVSITAAALSNIVDVTAAI